VRRSAWYRNCSPHGLHFELLGLVYTVPVGASVELPVELAWYPARVGLPLEPGPEPSDPALRVEPVSLALPPCRLPDGVGSGRRPPALEDEEEEPESVAEVEEAAAAVRLPRRRR